MSITWGAFKTVVRRSILKDVNGTKWSDDNLLDYVGWALDAFCAHTAYASSTTYEGDGVTYQFTLPDNVFVPLEEAGLVYLFDPSDEHLPIYLQPVYTSFDVQPSDPYGYYTWPEGTLCTTQPVDTDITLVVRHYAKYTHPLSDSDLITVPTWAHAAIAYRMGAYALAGLEIREAKISSYDAKPDTGNPEDNATRIQAESWFKRYQDELALHPKQVRVSAPRDRTRFGR